MYAATGHSTVVYVRRRQRTVRLPEARALLRLRVVKSQRGALAPKYHQDHPQTGHRVRFACAVRLVRGRVSSSAAAASASAIRGQSCGFGFLCVPTRCAIGRALLAAVLAVRHWGAHIALIHFAKSLGFETQPPPVHSPPGWFFMTPSSEVLPAPGASEPYSAPSPA